MSTRSRHEQGKLKELLLTHVEADVKSSHFRIIWLYIYDSNILLDVEIIIKSHYLLFVSFK